MHGAESCIGSGTGKMSPGMTVRELGQQPQGLGPGHRLGASLDAQLSIDVAGMGLDGVQRDEQALADLLV